MSKWDVEYLKLCKKILTEGVEVENRTGINTMKISDYNFNFDLNEEFPFLTTKQLYYKAAIKKFFGFIKELMMLDGFKKEMSIFGMNGK